MRLASRTWAARNLKEKSAASRWEPHTGPFMDGTPPTGRTVAYPLALFTQVEGDKIRSDRVYFDRQTAAEQLGLKAK